MRVLAFQVFGVAGSYASLVGVLYAVKATEQIKACEYLCLIRSFG